jgi:hypothetical protein
VPPSRVLIACRGHEPIHASLRRQQDRIKLILAILLIVLPAVGGEGMAIGILDGADDTQNSNGDIDVDI